MGIHTIVVHVVRGERESLTSQGRSIDKCSEENKSPEFGVFFSSPHLSMGIYILENYPFFIFGSLIWGQTRGQFL